MGSGRLRYVLNTTLAPAEAKRVRLTRLSQPSTRPNDWWRSRTGVKDFMYAWLELIYARTVGDDHRPRPEGAAAFQRAIRVQIGEAGP